MLSDYTPIAPTRVREPLHRDGWVYEEKVDGWRMLAYKDGDRVRLVSRNGRDHTRRFHDIAAAVSKLSARKLVLDGEVAIYDQRLRSRFEWLREADADAIATPPVFMAFDLLHQDGREFTGRPLRDRRARLEIVVAGSEFVFPVRRLARNGFEAWSEVIARDYGGLVAKDETSLYERLKRVVITGAMGSGKSTLLAELRKRGFTVVPEPARIVLAEQHATGGDGVPERSPYAEAGGLDQLRR